jgi:Spy/CpxP family protein refolding chaperone
VYAEPGSYTAHYLHHLFKHQKEIGLTDEQVTKLKALSLDFDKARIKHHADIEIAERELAALAHDEKADLTAIETKLKEVKALEVTAQLAAIKTKREALALLTPEQRDKEKAEHGKMMSHWKKGGHRDDSTTDQKEKESETTSKRKS